MQLQLTRASRVGIEYANMLCGAGASFCLSTAAERPVAQARIFETKRERGPCMYVCATTTTTRRRQRREEIRFRTSRVTFRRLVSFFFDVFASSFIFYLFRLRLRLAHAKNEWLGGARRDTYGLCVAWGFLGAGTSQRTRGPNLFSHSTRSDTLITFVKQP